MLAADKADVQERTGQHHQAHDGLRRVPRARGKAAQPHRQQSPSANTRGRPRARARSRRWARRFRWTCSIKGMIVQSGNDATIALAEKLGGTEDGFVQMMNSYAAELGLEELPLRQQLGRPGPDALHERARHRTLSRALIRDYPRVVQAVLAARVRVERHQAAEPQRPAGARFVGRRHQDRPHRKRWLLPRELGEAQRHAAHLRGARHEVVQGARRRQRRAAQLRLTRFSKP